MATEQDTAKLIAAKPMVGFSKRRRAWIAGTLMTWVGFTLLIAVAMTTDGAAGLLVALGACVLSWGLSLCARSRWA
jgi:hypothetical protein